MMFDSMTNKKKLWFGCLLLALVLVVFGVGFLAGKATVACDVCKPEEVNFSLFWDAYHKLRQHSIDPGAITDKKILYGAISGMAKSLGDPYTSFFEPGQAKMFQESLEGSFGGIGIEVAVKKGQLTVVAPLKGTPSERAGLKSGDQIVKINGKNAADISEEEAVASIRGKRGTQVTLTIFREGWNQTKDFTITRDTIKIPSVEWELLSAQAGKEGEIAYIHIYQFDQLLSSDFKKLAMEILKSPAKKIVLDLRDNPGGYLEVSQEIAGWFLPKGQVVTIEDFGPHKPRQEFKAEGSASLARYPLVVLINEGSASASEILAGALRDQRNITLVGKKSFGKGSVQEVVYLEDKASFLKVTIAKWLTPKGNSISEVGLDPDREVEPDLSEEGIAAKKDPQLDKALEIISELQ